MRAQRSDIVSFPDFLFGFRLKGVNENRRLLWKPVLCLIYSLLKSNASRLLIKYLLQQIGPINLLEMIDNYWTI